MKMRKMLALGLASAMAVSLAACGGSASSSEAPAASEAAPAASEAASTAEAATSEAAPAADASTGDKEKLTIALRGGTYAAVVEACLPAFEADNNCEIEFLELEGDDLHSKLALDSVNPEGAYDLAMVGSSWVAEFLENDMVANLTELGYSFDDDVIGATTRSLMKDGNAYFAPYFGNVTVMMYNKELVEAAGYKPEDITSWEDVRAIAEKVHDMGKNGFVTRGGGADPVLMDFAPVLLANGGDLVDADHNPTVDNDTFKTALNMYMELRDLGQTMEKDDMVANLEAGEGALATIWPGWYSPTADGNCGYIVSPSKLTKDGPEVNTSVLGEWEIAIPANSTHKELAVKLLTYLMDPEVQAGTVELGGVPCRYSALTSPEALAAHPEFEVVAGALDTGWSRPVISQWSDFCDILGTEVDNIIQGMDDMDQGLAQAQSELEDLMAE